MMPALAALLACQLAGEITTRALGLPLPGPVLGMLLLIALLLVIAWERHFFRRQSAAVRTVKESA